NPLASPPPDAPAVLQPARVIAAIPAIATAPSFLFILLCLSVSPASMPEVCCRIENRTSSCSRGSVRVDVFVSTADELILCKPFYRTVINDGRPGTDPGRRRQGNKGRYDFGPASSASLSGADAACSSASSSARTSSR